MLDLNKRGARRVVDLPEINNPYYIIAEKGSGKGWSMGASERARLHGCRAVMTQTSLRGLLREAWE
jgi:hypothetical protein